MGQGYVFIRVCDSVHRGEGVSVFVLGGRVSVLGGLCPGGLCPRESLSGGSLSRDLCSREVSVKETPLYGNERAVRILLEWILV